MGQDYRHFSLEERCEIARLQAEGRSLRQIAAALGRAPSSVTRELKRNAGSTIGYRPAYAEQRAKARRWTGSKLDREPDLRDRVLTHLRLHQLELRTFFCDTHSPWQKGGIENAIGRMRRFLPRKTDLAAISDHQFNALIAIYNHTPRKCLDFKTPAEVFCSQLLHFECESTPQLALG